jgi:hypothetical protein
MNTVDLLIPLISVKENELLLGRIIINVITATYKIIIINVIDA